MRASEALPAVLDRIDRDLDASLDRLFALLRIQSVSTDPSVANMQRFGAQPWWKWRRPPLYRQSQRLEILCEARGARPPSL
jgi:hypothetical protein